MMGNIISRYLRFVPMAVFSLGMIACSSDEPENPDEDSTNVTLNLNLKLDASQSEEQKAVYTPSSSDYKQRFIVEIYQNREVVTREVEVKDISAAGSVSVPVSVKLPPKEYQVVVWADYVSASNPDADLYYNTENLIPIVPVSDTYTGNAEYKDAFSATVKADLTSYEGKENASVDMDVLLSRPVVRYSLTTTDVAAFLRRVASGKITGTVFTARITYTSYLSVGYNVYDDVAKQSLKDQSYTTTFSLPESGTTELELGFDYIFVNAGEEIQVPLTIEILDEQQQVVASTSTSISCERGKVSAMRGRFLTTDVDGGISIDPDYDKSVSVDLGTLK